MWPGAKSGAVSTGRSNCSTVSLTFRLSLTVAHYPTGASKWNPIEHRLFSEISRNWAGEPLDRYPTILNFIRTTRTGKGQSNLPHKAPEIFHAI